MKKLSLLLFGLIAFLLAAAGSAAAQQEVVLTIRDGQPAISFALPPFAASAQARAAADEIHGILEADLKYTRVFALLPKSYYAYIQTQSLRTIRFEDWQSINAAVLFTGEVSLGSNGDLVLERNFYDVKSKRQILPGKRYQAKPADLRFLAHRMADEIMKSYGEKPLFTSKIAFVSDRDGNDELYMMDYDGANQTRLTFNKVLDYSPAWASDASRLAYTSYQNLVAGLYILDVYEGKRTTVSIRGGNFTPTWSPDGKKLAFGSSMDGNQEIYAADVESGPTRVGKIKRLTFSPASDISPTWSPNGREIAFTSDRGGTPQIYLMDAEGGNIRRLSFGANYHDSPAWSPNGDQIVYVARVDNVFDLYIYNIRTRAIQKLTESNARNESPSWSPDGRHVVFTSNMKGGTQVWAIDVDGANLRPLTAKGQNKLADWSN
ncbi:MAG: Tol-Pal system beta propeller repeat protein TolB [Candidatus Aminicenantes bacterium]|nr:Tol-Pal system beta propeller repeat protein TolB [Candidatus Aminicenantes bacterium]